MGNITQAWSVREGSNFITTIESFDGGYAYNNAQTNTSFPKGTTYDTVITTLADSLPQTTLGTIGDTYTNSLGRGNAISGRTMDLLNTYTGGGTFIDLGAVNCLAENECLSGGLPVIDDSSGLLGTPVLELTKLTFDMIFEPHLLVGQLINLNSAEGAANAGNFNGNYKIVTIKHRGAISGAICGEVITSVELYAGTQTLNVVAP